MHEMSCFKLEDGFALWTKMVVLEWLVQYSLYSSVKVRSPNHSPVFASMSSMTTSTGSLDR